MTQDNKTLMILAYCSALLGVCGHDSSELFLTLKDFWGESSCLENWLSWLCLINILLN